MKTDTALWAFFTFALLYYSIIDGKIKLKTLTDSTLSNSERYNNLKSNIDELFIPFVISLMLGVLPAHGTVFVVKKFYSVPELGHTFVSDNFTAVYSCKYKYKENTKKISYGKCSFEWNTPDSQDDCAIWVEKIDNIKIEESCMWVTDKWEECYTTSGKSIWVYILDDKIE